MCCKVHILQSTHVEKCMCLKIRWQAIHIVCCMLHFLSYTLYLTYCINLSDIDLRYLWKLNLKNLSITYWNICSNLNLRNHWKPNLGNCTCCNLHVWQIVRVSNCTCCKLHMLQIAHVQIARVRSCICFKLRMLQLARVEIARVANYMCCKAHV